jgi:hypothetical protein
MNYVASGRLGDFLHVLYVVYYHSREHTTPPPISIYLYSGTAFGGEPFSRGFHQTFTELKDFVAQWCPYVSNLIHLKDGEQPPTGVINLNRWRTIHGRTDWITSLNTYYKLSSLNLQTVPAWCYGGTPVRPVEEPYVVLHRSLVRHNPDFPWAHWIQTFSTKKIYFITSSPAEYEAFPWKHMVLYQPCETLCSMAQWIYHADWFIGNQSSPLAMAVSLGKRCLAELNPNLLDGICYMNSPMSNGDVYWYYNSRNHRLPPVEST